MNELIFRIEQNLIQIKALRYAKIKTTDNQWLLTRRESEVRRDIDRLHIFANRKPGYVAMICNEIADAIQKRLAY
jgi:hypothetical protein